MLSAECMDINALANILMQLPNAHQRYACFTRKSSCVLDDIYQIVRNQPVNIHTKQLTIRLFRVDYVHAADSTYAAEDRHELIIELYNIWKHNKTSKKLPRNPYKCHHFCDWVFDNTDVRSSDYVAVIYPSPASVTVG